MVYTLTRADGASFVIDATLRQDEYPLVIKPDWKGGTKKTVAAAAAPPAATIELPSWYVWVSGGLTIVAGGATIWLAKRAGDKEDEANAFLDQTSPSQREHFDAIEDAEDAIQLRNIGAATTVALLVVTTTLWLVDGPSEPKRTTRVGDVRVGPGVVQVSF